MAEAKAETVSLGERLRRGALFVLFGLVLLIPKTLSLRRRRGPWNALRLVAGAAGAVLLYGKSGSGWSDLAGLLLLLFALLAWPAKQGKTVDAQARELGALVVLNGGRVRWGGKETVARLFLAPERIHVLDLKHQPLLEIPLSALREARAAQAGEKWKLQVAWEGGEAEFDYDGFFAEHLARVAETTLRSQLRRELPILK